MAKKKIYAVRKGKTTGIFYSWDECSASVNGYPGAEYKSFTTKEEANSYLGNSFAAQIEEEIEQYRENTLPAIIQIPGVSGNTGAGVNGVKKTVEQAVGSDILFGGVS